MTSPDSNADTTSSKYHVQIGEGKGIVIGDNTHVVQHFDRIPLESQVDLTAAEAIYRQRVVDAYKWLNFSGFGDLSLANVLLEDVFVRLALSSQARRRESQQRERVITVPEPVELGQVLSSLCWLRGTSVQKMGRLRTSLPVIL